MPGVPLVNEPPARAFDKEIEEPTQTESGPIIALGVGLTVNKVLSLAVQVPIVPVKV
jgi:hypothetical protein